MEIKAPVDYVNPYMGNISQLSWYRLIRLSIYLNSMLTNIYLKREDYTSNKIERGVTL
mgnify:CR=1 FL=1